MTTEAESAPVDTFRHPDPNEINEVRNEMPPDPPAKPQSAVAESSTLFDTSLSLKSITCETK